MPSVLPLSKMICAVEACQRVEGDPFLDVPALRPEPPCKSPVFMPRNPICAHRKSTSGCRTGQNCYPWRDFRGRPMRLATVDQKPAPADQVPFRHQMAHPANRAPPALRARRRALPVIHIGTMGNLGNQMIQFAIGPGPGRAASVHVRFSNVQPAGLAASSTRSIAGDFPASEINHLARPCRWTGFLRALAASGALQRAVTSRTYGAKDGESAAAAGLRGCFSRQRRPGSGHRPGPDELL